MKIKESGKSPYAEEHKVEDKRRANYESAWWLCDKNEAHDSIFTKVMAIRENQRSRRIDWLRYARLYTNTAFDQFLSGLSASKFGSKISFNVARGVVDTAAAKISKAKPRAYFLTEKGDFSQQKRAERLTQYCDGMFHDLGIYKKGKNIFRDGCIFGTGAIKLYKQDGKVQAERVFIDELIVDDLDGRNMEPRELHQGKMVHKEVLKGMYPKFAKEIDAAVVDWSVLKGKTSTTEMIAVCESWHLKSGEKADDGRHVISLENCTLFDEKWDGNRFPFAVFRYSPPLLGYYGEGMIAQVVGIQIEINNILSRIQEGLDLVAVPKVLVEETSSVASQSLTNGVGSVIKYRGTPPQFVTPVAFTREVYDYLEYMYRRGFEEAAVSQLSAQSKKPAGLESGVALREYQDIETDRFSLVADAYQQLYLDCAAIMIELQRELAKDGEKMSVKSKGKKFIETIKWKDAEMDDDSFVMQAYPTNFLPKTPEGQFQYVQELVQSGFIETEEAMGLLEFPDLQAFFSAKNAALDDIKFLIERMVDEQEYTSPDPYMNLALAVKLTQSAYLRGKTNGTSEISLELLRRFIDDCQALLIMSAPQIPPTEAPPSAPLANAAPPPVSDLVPIA